jgi:hypothetical protein
MNAGWITATTNRAGPASCNLPYSEPTFRNA